MVTIPESGRLPIMVTTADPETPVGDIPATIRLVTDSDSDYNVSESAGLIQLR